jgi:hypothetical protein
VFGKILFTDGELAAWTSIALEPEREDARPPERGGRQVLPTKVITERRW